MIQIKRVYEPSSKNDGYRILVDRLWPRGIKKVDLHLDEWAKDIAPSPELRKWFGHKAENWKKFRSKYAKELKNKDLKEKITEIAKRSKKSRVTLLYAAHDEEHNHAIVLKEFIEHI